MCTTTQILTKFLGPREFDRLSANTLLKLSIGTNLPNTNIYFSKIKDSLNEKKSFQAKCISQIWT